jgi:hypothetical protein
MFKHYAAIADVVQSMQRLEINDSGVPATVLATPSIPWITGSRARRPQNEWLDGKMAKCGKGQLALPIR